MRIVCIGDSITAGQHLAPGEKAWPALIHGHKVIARGVNGDTTRLMLERFPADVQEQAPDVVIIQAGHNDCNRWASDRWLPRVSLEAFAANLREMFSRCRAFDAEPIVCTPTPTRRGIAYEQDLCDYAGTVRLAAHECGVQLVDTSFAFHTRKLDRVLLADGLHLSAEGHQLYAACVADALVRSRVAA